MADESAPELTTAAAEPVSLIYLDVDDEITSAAARIRAAGADDVALVLPFGSRLATSRIKFRMLGRVAAALGKKIAIVCADASARALAVAAGLPTHASVAAFEAHRSGTPDAGNGTAASAGAPPTPGNPGAPRGPAVAVALDPGADDTRTRVLATPRRKPAAVPRVGPPRPPVRTGIAIGVGVAVIVAVIAGGLLALEFLPSATITLHPRAEALGPLELSVEARESVPEPDPAAMTIPAQRFQFTVEASQTFPATGVRVEETAATGTVTFSNFDTGRGVLVPKGTVVRTDDDVEFRTTAELTLPRARIDFFPPFPVQPSNGDVGVEAVEPGLAGNVGNNTIVDVPGAGRNLRVTNEAPTTGGARTELPEVSPEDVEAAQTALTAELIAELDRQVAAGEGIPDGITLFPATRAIDEPEYSVDLESLVGTEGQEFDLGASATGSALGVDAAPIQALAETRLATRVTDGWSIPPGAVTLEVGAPAVLNEIIVYPVTVAGTQVRDVDETALLASIRGLALPDARARLDDLGDVEIEVWPDWVTKIPTRADRVTLTLAEPQALPTP